MIAKEKIIKKLVSLAREQDKKSIKLIDAFKKIGLVCDDAMFNGPFELAGVVLDIIGIPNEGDWSDEAGEGFCREYCEGVVMGDVLYGSKEVTPIDEVYSFLLEERSVLAEAWGLEEVK